MNRLVKAILDFIPTAVFTPTEISALLPGSDDLRYTLLKRAMADGDIIRIRRGLYTLAPLYKKQKLIPYSVSQYIKSRSYISLELALYLHGWMDP